MSNGQITPTAPTVTETHEARLVEVLDDELTVLRGRPVLTWVWAWVPVATGG